MASDISLTSASRNALLSLNQTSSLMSRTQNRLTSGTKVASAVDDAVAYFQAKSLNDRASSFVSRKSELQDVASTVGAAVAGVNAVDSLLNQAKGVVRSAAELSANPGDNAGTLGQLKDQYNTILKQIDSAASDSSYQGKNLLAGGKENDLTVSFSGSTATSFTVSSRALNTSESSLNLQAVDSFSSDESERLKSLDQASQTVRSRAADLGGSASYLQSRMDFTSNYINTLQEGSGKLTLADLNEEGANLVALQTRQQIGVQSLSIAGQQQQAILSLLR